MILVSVICPYFKKKRFIDKSINSVLNQSYINIEVIIVYDDNNLADYNFLLEKYKKNKNIRILKNKKNFGAGVSRNKGIEISNGEYLAFLDADDIWDKKKIEKQLSFMIKNNLQISHTSYEIINDNDQVIGKRLAKNFINYKSLLKSCNIGLSSVMVKKSILKNDLFFPNIKTKEDFVLWLKLLKNNYKIIAYTEYLTKWRKTKNSLSSSIIQKLRDGFKVYNYYMKYNSFKSIYLLICLSINFLKKND